MGRHYDYDISERLIEELYKLGRTSREIAERTGCSSHLVWNYLNGSIPSVVMMKQLHKAGCDIMYIITGEANSTHD